MGTQPQALGVAHMVDPALHAGIELAKADLPFVPRRVARMKVARGVAHFAGFDAHPVGAISPAWRELNKALDLLPPSFVSNLVSHLVSHHAAPNAARILTR
jgi:hypothetical protein